MTTCRDTIIAGLRKARVYSAGEIPTDEDMLDGLGELQNLYEQWWANGMFGRLTDVLTNSDYEAAAGERIRATNGAVITIPTEFEDDGEDYPPYDMAMIEVIDVDAQSVARHLYDAGQGAWVEIGALELDDIAPLSSKGRGGLAACLAVSYAEEFGAEVGPGTLRQAASFKTGLSLKFGGDAQRTAPDYF